MQTEGVLQLLARFLRNEFLLPQSLLLVENLKDLQLTDLIDKLAVCTEQYTQSYSQGALIDELEAMKLLIIELQQEIRSRTAKQYSQSS